MHTYVHTVAKLKCTYSGKRKWTENFDKYV